MRRAAPGDALARLLGQAYEFPVQSIVIDCVNARVLGSLNANRLLDAAGAEAGAEAGADADDRLARRYEAFLRGSLAGGHAPADEL